MTQELWFAEFVGLLLAALVIGWRANARENATAAESDVADPDDEDRDTDLAPADPVEVETGGEGG